MAKTILSKNSSRLNLTSQIYIFHETIHLTDQMSEFLNGLPLKQITHTDIQLAVALVKKWIATRNIFINKATSLLDCMYSLERAYEEYIKLVANVEDLNNAKVIMLSMLDRVRQIVGTFRAIR